MTTNPYRTPLADNAIPGREAAWQWKAAGWKATAVWVLSVVYGVSALAFVLLAIATIQQAIDAGSKGWPDLFFSSLLLLSVTAAASATAAFSSMSLYHICRDIRNGNKAATATHSQ